MKFSPWHPSFARPQRCNKSNGFRNTVCAFVAVDGLSITRASAFARE